MGFAVSEIKQLKIEKKINKAYISIDGTKRINTIPHGTIYNRAYIFGLK